MAVFVMLVLSLVSALDSTDLTIKEVRLNDKPVSAGEIFAVDEGELLEIEVGLRAASGANDIEIEARLSGYEYSDYENLQDSTGLFDLQANNTKYEELTIALPNKLDKDQYLLRIRVLDKNTNAITMDVPLSVEPSRRGIDIADVVFSPGNTVKAGRSLLTTVLLENYGDKDERDVKVSIEIPELGVRAAEFVDKVETDNHNIDREDVPEMFLPIPASAEEKEYEVIVSARYNDLRETVAKTYRISVVGNEMFAQPAEKLVLAVGPDSQNVAAGTTATYGIALTNAGRTSKAYTLSVVSGDWASVSLSENLIVLEPGKNKVVYVDVAANSGASAGQHVVSVAVKTGDEVLETVALTGNVVSAPRDSISLRNGLEIALIVLVVLLVIIGLIVGFSRLRKSDEEDQTYY